jgi:NADH:ubiquinone oxidoreductase subunit D
VFSSYASPTVTKKLSGVFVRFSCAASFTKNARRECFHADVPDYYLPPKEDVYTSMESLIYHFKIVMGEVPVPVAEIYHPVEGGNGEWILFSYGSNAL